MSARRYVHDAEGGPVGRLAPTPGGDGTRPLCVRRRLQELAGTIDTTPSGRKLICHRFVALAEYEHDLSVAQVVGSSVSPEETEAALAFKHDGQHTVHKLGHHVGISRHTFQKVTCGDDLPRPPQCLA